MWEDCVAMHPYMGWGLFALQATKAQNKLLNWRITSKYEVRKYVLQLKETIYQDGGCCESKNVLFIHNYIGMEEIAIVRWVHSWLPTP